MHMHFGVFRSGPRQMTLLKYYNRIEPSKEERIQSVLPKPEWSFSTSNPMLSNRKC